MELVKFSKDSRFLTSTDLQRNEEPLTNLGSYLNPSVTFQLLYRATSANLIHCHCGSEQTYGSWVLSSSRAIATGSAYTHSSNGRNFFPRTGIFRH